MWRGKDSLARTWLQRWKRVTWMQHLSGRILRPSMEDRFETEYISSRRGIRVRANPVPAKGSENKTLDGFGRILKESCRQLDLFGASLKMSPATLPLDSPQFTEACEIWVTQLRRDCLRRQKSELRTDESGCLSWLTPETQNQDGYQIVNGKKIPRLGRQVNWPTIQMADAKMCKFNKRGNPHLGKVAGVWPTPAHRDYRNQHAENSDAFRARRENPRGVNLVEFLQRLAGQPDQANSSTNGKSRGLWRTPSNDAEGGRMEIRSGCNARLKLRDQTKGKLNPDWVEQLMGLTVGWTDCDFSATGSCPSRRKRHLDT